MVEPRDVVDSIEVEPRIPRGADERLAGWGVFGLPFASGHLLALRRFPASSIGSGYTSVWHRDPTGRWVIYTNVDPTLACPRYFGSAIDEAIVAPIGIHWSGPRGFSVSIDDTVQWSVTLLPTLATRAMNVIGGLIPEQLWRHAPVLSVIGGVAGRALSAGHVGLHGQAPNGQEFEAVPKLVWTIPESFATVHGADLGPVGPLAEQARLTDFWLPQRGLFMIGRAVMEAFNPTRHLAATCNPEGRAMTDTEPASQATSDHLRA